MNGFQITYCKPGIYSTEVADYLEGNTIRSVFNRYAFKLLKQYTSPVKVVTSEKEGQTLVRYAFEESRAAGETKHDIWAITLDIDNKEGKITSSDIKQLEAGLEDYAYVSYPSWSADSLRKTKYNRHYVIPLSQQLPVTRSDNKVVDIILTFLSSSLGIPKIKLEKVIDKAGLHLNRWFNDYSISPTNQKLGVVFNADKPLLDSSSLVLELMTVTKKNNIEQQRATEYSESELVIMRMEFEQNYQKALNRETPKGNRHNSLFAIACKMYSYGYDDWEERLDKLAKRWEYTTEEELYDLEKIKESISNGSYF